MLKKVIIIVVELNNFESEIKLLFLSLNTENYDYVQNYFMKISSDIHLKLCEEFASIMWSWT